MWSGSSATDFARPDEAHGVTTFEAQDCRVCRANSGETRISPGPTIYEGVHWLVEHAYPTSLLGWTVLVLKRHAEALHDLSREEGEELGVLQWAVSRALEAETECTKEYAVFFAELPEFRHVHVHMVPRAVDLPPDLRGRRVFELLKPTPEETVAPADVVRFCERLAERVASDLV